MFYDKINKNCQEAMKLADKKVIITRDSTSDLPPEIVEALNIKTVPLVDPKGLKNEN